MSMTKTDSEIIPVYTGETDSKMESIMKVEPKSGVCMVVMMFTWLLTTD